MGELLIKNNFANKVLKVMEAPDQLYWKWGPYQLDVAARWLPKKVFNILPSIFDADYI
jgi:hypothetical protein